ncbi:hypothetical protein VIVU109783_19145 [Vibrio vulnificus]
MTDIKIHMECEEVVPSKLGYRIKWSMGSAFVNRETSKIKIHFTLFLEKEYFPYSQDELVIIMSMIQYSIR